jgi:CheY-like chemotaxis protein
MNEITIAWIEDDAEELDTLLNPLRRANFVIKPFHSYSEVLAHLDEIRQCNLILLDIVIPPGPDTADQADDDEYLGKTLLKRFRREFNLVQPVIVLSFFAQVELSEKELRSLNAQALTKPIRPSAIKKAVFDRLGLSSSN